MAGDRPAPASDDGSYAGFVPQTIGSEAVLEKVAPPAKTHRSTASPLWAMVLCFARDFKCSNISSSISQHF